MKQYATQRCNEVMPTGNTVGSLKEETRRGLNKTANLHLSDIIPGVYFLQLTGTDDKMYRFKFVKK